MKNSHDQSKPHRGNKRVSKADMALAFGAGALGAAIPLSALAAEVAPRSTEMGQQEFAVVCLTDEGGIPTNPAESDITPTSMTYDGVVKCEPGSSVSDIKPVQPGEGNVTVTYALKDGVVKSIANQINGIETPSVGIDDLVAVSADKAKEIVMADPTPGGRGTVELKASKSPSGEAVRFTANTYYEPAEDKQVYQNDDHAEVTSIEIIDPNHPE